MFGHVYHLHFLFLKEPDNFGWASVFLLLLSNFRLISSYFVLATIITFDLVLHICIYIIHTEYFWLVLAGLKEIFYTLTLKFVYITSCLLTEPQTMLQLKILMAFIDLILLQKFFWACAFCLFIAHLCKWRW